MFSLVFTTIFISVTTSNCELCIPSMSWPMIMKNVEANVNELNMNLSESVTLTSDVQYIRLINNQTKRECTGGYMLKIDPCLDPPSYIFVDKCHCNGRSEKKSFKKLIVMTSPLKYYLIYKSISMNMLTKCMESIN